MKNSNPPGKKNLQSFLIAGLLATGLQLASANTQVWIGVAGTSVSTNWSDNANWLQIGAGGAGPNGNDVVFGDPGAIGTVNTVNSVVDQNLLNPFSLTFTNNSTTSKFHTLLIPAGISVTNANGLTVGINSAAVSYLTTVNFTGPGTFVQNGNLTVKNATSTGGSGVLPFLDMSGLSNFVLNASASTLTVAGTGGDARGSGRLDLAGGTNNVTIGTITVAVATGNGGLGGTINLGAGTNNINVGTINLAGGKVNNATMKFLGATGGLRLRGVTGADSDRTVTMVFANRNNTGSGTPNGTMDFTGGHVVDVKATTVTLGQCTGSNPTSAQGNSATLKFDAGKVDVTTVNMAVNSQANVTSTGNLVVGGGTLIVSNISLVNQTGGNGVGNLSVGGLLIVSNSIAKTSTVGTGNFTLTNGTLTLVGSATAGSVAKPIDNVTMADSTNNLNPGSTAVIVANNLTTGGAGNLINISTLPVITSYPKQFPLIAYAGGIGGSGFNFTLGALPSGSPAYAGYISNNLTTLSVDLVLTSGPIPVGLAIWNGTANSSWDTSTFNWTNLGAAAIFHQGDAVQFDDSATGSTTVSLTNSLQPGSIVVSNFTKLYTFSGTGKLSGTGGLTKNGNNTLILDHSGVSDFSGALTISAGTVQVGNGNTNGNIPALASVQDDAALVFNHTDAVTLPNAVSGAGTLTQNGSGKLTLTSANGYLGNTFVRNGTLALSGVGSVASSPVVAVSSAGTFDVSGIASGPFSASAVTLTNGTLALGVNTATISALAATNSTISLIADANAVTLVATSLTTGGATNFFNVTAVNNVPPSPPLPVVIPLVTYTTLTGTFNFGETGFPNAYVSNDVATSTIYLVLTAEPYLVNWNGGSGTGNNWTDAANWTGVSIGSGDSLIFDGVARVNNTNNTAAGTAYTNITFNSGAGAFTLNGNAINLGGNIVNNSANTQTILLGLNYGGSRTLNGASGAVVVGGGLTNTLASGTATVTLLGTGVITNNFTGGTNLLLVNDAAANWTLLDNAGSTTVTTPTAFAINNGTFNFGSAGNAPKLTSTTPQGVPQDNQVGTVASSTATLNINNGTFTTSARVNTGAGGNATGVLTVGSGATLNVASQFQGANGAATSISAVTNAGTMNIGTAATPTGTFYVASRGNGTLTMNGGILNCGILDTSRNAAGNTGGSIGLVNLNGGVLTCTSVTNIAANAQTGGSPTAQINFNGGTLRARANMNYHGSTATPAVPITSYVQAGGAILDSSNFTVTVLEPLVSDPALAGSPDGGLLKLGSGSLVMAAANTYIGNTVVSNGTLNVSGSLDQTAVRVAGGTLSGTGSIASNVTVQAAGTISPAGAATVGTLTITGNLILQGTTAMDLNQGAATSDNLAVSGAVTYGGTLALTNLSGTLTTADTFTLFTAGSRSGAFAALSPATPGVGLAWNTNTLVADGILRIAVGVNTAPTNITTSVSGSTLTLSWPADHIGWRLQAQTNSLSTGLSGTWFDVPGSASVNSLNFTINPANGSVFYRMVYP